MDAPDTALHGQNTTITGCLYMAFELGDKCMWYMCPAYAGTDRR